MKHAIVLFLALALLLPALPAMAAKYVESPVKQNPDELVGMEQRTSRLPQAGPSAAYSYPGELDEPAVGDTLLLVHNWRDQQHNSGFTRMIAMDYSDPDTALALMAYKWHDAEPPNERVVKFLRVKIPTDGDPFIDPGLADPTNGGNVLSAENGGYTVISLDPETDATTGQRKEYITYHEPVSGNWQSKLSWESPWVPNFYEGTLVPFYDGTGLNIWPQVAMARESGTLYAHMITNGYDTIEDHSFYRRLQYDPGTSTFTNATPGGVELSVVTTSQGALCTLPLANDDGTRVVVVNTNQRAPLGLEPSSELDWASSDVVYYESTDGGATFDFDSYTNVTSFAAPDADALPDTVAAEKDTMRAYAEVDGIIDGDNTLHLAFNTHFFYYYQGSATYTARNWYWNETDDLFVQLADGSFWNNATPIAWEQVVSHAQLYKDDATGITWAIWVQYGEPGDTLYIPEEDIALGLDCTDDAFANTDIYVSASPPGEANGKLWTKGVNVTNTRTMDTLLVAGESRSERDPSIAYESDGDYLNLFYTIDHDAGSFIAEQAEATENEMVFHRINKQALIDTFEARGEWQPNYPMHYDSTGFWWDQGEYMWEEFGGFYTVWPRDPESVQGGMGLAPREFELEQNYPNPFNPSTSIRFELASRADVRLAVYDVMGREVATLVDRRMDAGQHAVTFLADELPSGVYFYRLTSGDATQVRKMVLMK